MPHETTLIATIVAGLVLSFIGGIFAGRLRLPAWLSARRCSSGVFHAGFVVDETLGAAPGGGRSSVLCRDYPWSYQASRPGEPGES